MTRRICFPILLASLFFVCLGPAADAGPEPGQIILQPDAEYVGSIDHETARYLKVTLVNLADEAATCRIAFYRERVELSADRVGPVEFRTFTLAEKNARQTRIWTTLNFDEFTLDAVTGRIQVVVEQTMTIE